MTNHCGPYPHSIRLRLASVLDGSCSVSELISSKMTESDLIKLLLFRPKHCESWKRSIKKAQMTAIPSRFYLSS